MARDMNKTLMRISTLALLLMVSMGTWADVTILGESSGTSASGKYKGSASGNTFSLTVTPATGYKITKAKIEVYETIDPTKAGTRADIQMSILELSGPDEVAAGDNGVYTYTFNDTEDHDIVISKIEFTQSGTKGDRSETITLTDEGFAGTYYIRSESSNKNTPGDYYLCPTRNWYLYKPINSYEDDTDDDDDNGKPFLTTYQCKDGEYDLSKAVWIIKKHPSETDCYYVIQKKTGRYMISNGKIGSDANRMRVHLETVADDEALSALGDLALFEITEHEDHIDMIPHSVEGRNGNTYKYLVVNFRNFNELKGSAGKVGGPNGTYGTNTAGIIGLYDTEVNHKWSLEDYIPRPTIQYNSEDKIEITYPSDPSATIYYNTDESDTYTKYTGALSIDESCTIKAVAITSDDETTKVSEFVVHIPIGLSHPYLISSNQNPWTDGENNEYIFYLIPSDVSNGNTTVNTTSMPRPSMEWYIRSAGEANEKTHFYFVNAKTGDYLYRTGDAIYMKTSEDKATLEAADDNGCKFYLIKKDDGFSIVPYGVTAKFLNKANGNNASNAVNLGGNDNAYSRWNFISKNDLDTDPPFEVSDNTSVTYYRIESFNNGDSGYFIVPQTSTNASVTTSTTASDDMNWYFEVAERHSPADTDDWQTYYRIVNAVTGKYLYYTGNTGNSSHKVSGSIDKNNINCHYAIVKSPQKDTYYIVPRSLRDRELARISTLYNYINNGTPYIQVGINRNTNNITWTFKPGTLDIAPPIIKYDAANNKVVITSTTIGATIKYTQGDSSAEDPSSEGVVYSEGDEGFDLPDEINVIRAIAIKGSNEVEGEPLLISVHASTSSKNIPYLIQSKDSRYHYMIPSAAVSGNTTVNTLNVPCQTMVWYFEDATIVDDVQYYYVKNSNGNYLYNTGDNIYMGDKSGTEEYRFSIEGTHTDGFNLLPYGKTKPVNKDGGNVASNAHNPIKLSGAKTDALSLWYFKPFTGAILQDNPFKTSDDDHTYYYRIQSETNDHYVLPSTAPITLQATWTTDEKESMWIICKDESTGEGGLLSYYSFLNAYTGEYLYYNKTATERAATQSFEMKSSSADGFEKDRSLFVVAQTKQSSGSEEINYYNIIPKIAVDNTRDTNGNGHTKASYNCMNRASNKDVLGTWMDTDNNSHWYFTQATNVKCFTPIITEDANGNIIITCVTPASEIRYTTDGSDPAISSPEYANETTGAQILIKAIAKLKNDDTDASNSEIVTLVNMPDIALSQTSYTYDGTAHEPSISKVSITATEGETEVTTGYSVAYSDNTDAGTATVTLTDDTDDNTYIWHASTTFTINPATLTITAEAKEKIYGEDDPELTYTNEGVVTGESLTDILTGSLTREEGEDVGEYAITQGTLELISTNYTLAYTGANFTISEKSIGEGGYDPASDITLDIIKNDNGTYNVTLKDGESELISGTEGTDYDFSQSEITDDVSGYYHYHSGTITGANNYTGSLIFSYVDVPFSKADGKSQEAGTFVITSAGKGDFATPSGMTAYIVTGISGNTLEVEALEYIPNGVPVLLLSDAAADGFFVHPKGSEETANVSANILNWKNEETHFGTAQIYVLYKGEFVLNIGGDLPAGRVYLPKSSVGVGGARLSIARSRTTGIESVPEEQDAIDRWYSIDGRRLSGKPTKKGLYIKNGHKVVIK